MRLAWLALLVATAARAGAAEDLLEADRLLGEVQDEAAIQVLTRALDRPELTAEQRVETYLLLGTARHNLRDEEGARLAFTRALETDRTAAVPRLASPKTRALFEAVRDEFTASHPVVVAPPPTPPPAVTRVSWVTPRRVAGLGIAAAGVGGVVAGVTLLSRAEATYGLARSAPVAIESDRLYRSAVSTNTAGGAVAAIGAAAMLGGLALALWPSSDPPVAVLVSSTSLTLVGRF